MDRKVVVLGLVAFVLGLVFLLNMGNLFPSYRSSTPLLYLATMVFEFVTAMLIFGGGLMLYRGLGIQLHGGGLALTILALLVILFFLLIFSPTVYN